MVSGSTSTSTVSYAYNAAGDITNQGSKTFSFNAESRLSSMAAGPTVTSPTTYYTHNALGQRVFKTQPTTGTATTSTSGFAFVYDEDGNLLGEYGTGGSASTGSAEYIWLPTPNGPMPIATVVNGTVLSVHTDHLNTPRMLSNTNAQAVWQWKYSAFGDEQPTLARNRFANLSVNPNPGTTTVAPVNFNLRYPGQYADSESGLNYNYFRSYYSSSGRYTQADPIGLDGGWNRFGYVGANPLGGIDYLGLQNIVFTAGGSGTAGPAGAEANSGFGYNFKSGDITGYTTTGVGAGTGSGFAGLSGSLGAAISFIFGGADNVGGIFINRSIAIPGTNLGFTSYRNENGELQGAGFSYGPGSGFGQTKTNTILYPVTDSRRDMIQRSNEFYRQLICRNRG